MLKETSEKSAVSCRFPLDPSSPMEMLGISGRFGWSQDLKSEAFGTSFLFYAFQSCHERIAKTVCGPCPRLALRFFQENIGKFIFVGGKSVVL